MGSARRAVGSMDTRKRARETRARSGPKRSEGGLPLSARPGKPNSPFLEAHHPGTKCAGSVRPEPERS